MRIMCYKIMLPLFVIGLQCITTRGPVLVLVVLIETERSPGSDGVTCFICLG